MMRILLLARDLKSYWASKSAKKKISEVIKLPAVIRDVFPFLAFFFYFLIASFAIFRSAKFDLVIAYEPRIGFFYGFLRKILKIGKPMILFQVILPEYKTFVGKIKFAFEKFSVGGLDILIVNSSFEKDLNKKRFGVDKFTFIPLHADPENIFTYSSREDDFIFTGGGAERDFSTLINVAQEINKKFTVITFSKSLLSNLKIPENVSLYYKVPQEKFIRTMAKAKIVVIPLLPTRKAAGQYMLLQAMALGKAIVISDNPSLRNYVENGKQAILVPPEDPKALKSAIFKLLKDPLLRRTLGRNARLRVREKSSFAKYDRHIEKLIKKAL